MNIATVLELPDVTTQYMFNLKELTIANAANMVMHDMAISKLLKLMTT